MKSRPRGEIQELKTRERERRERAREGARWRGERAADSGGAESRLRKMTAPRPLLSVLWGVLFSLREREREAGGGAPIGECERRFFFLQKGKNERLTHPSESFSFLVIQRARDRRVRAGADTLQHSSTGAWCCRGAAPSTHTHTRVEHNTPT